MESGRSELEQREQPDRTDGQVRIGMPARSRDGTPAQVRVQFSAEHVEPLQPTDPDARRFTIRASQDAAVGDSTRRQETTIVFHLTPWYRKRPPQGAAR